MHNMHKSLIRWRGPKHIAENPRAVQKSLLHTPVRLPVEPFAFFRYCFTVISISSRRVPVPRAASASVAVSTHSRGPPYPRAARTLFLTHLLACHVILFARRFPCRFRSNDPGAWRYMNHTTCDMPHALGLEVLDQPPWDRI